ncbi:hypothetical protein, partial [Xanthomonas theicola]|uniref:hypothetical protein n=1 Tax=Xanthomonas theicola TaxID=56464 RepID=UPI001B8087C4
MGDGGPAYRSGIGHVPDHGGDVVLRLSAMALEHPGPTASRWTGCRACGARRWGRRRVGWRKCAMNMAASRSRSAR